MVIVYWATKVFIRGQHAEPLDRGIVPLLDVETNELLSLVNFVRNPLCLSDSSVFGRIAKVYFLGCFRGSVIDAHAIVQLEARRISVVEDLHVDFPYVHGRNINFVPLTTLLVSVVDCVCINAVLRRIFNVVPDDSLEL